MSDLGFDISDFSLQISDFRYIRDLDFRFRISDFRFQNPGARGTGLLRPGEPLGGGWGNPAGRTAVTAL